MIPSFDSVFLALASGPWTLDWGGVLLVAASTGAVGMGLSDIASGLSDRLSGGDGEFGDEEFEGDGFGGDGFGDEDFGGGDDFDDGDFGDDWDDDGDDLDEWGDDGGLDDLGGGADGGGGAAADLEPRLEELEKEVASISSTMGTVRSENEAINETVEDIEDNIRKLLDIYEMVTRGVNPFVDDAQTSGGVGGSFGLFDEEDEGDDFDDLDPEVADADADSFFDDDFDEDGFEDDDFDDDIVAEEGPTSDGHDGSPADDVTATAATGDGSGDGGEGKTFDELKSEYESGAADWDADGAADGTTGAPGGGSDAADGGEEVAPPEGVESAPDPGDLGDSGPDAEPTASPPGPANGSDATGDQSDGDATVGATQPAADASDAKPYLESLPKGYGTELLVIEWLSYLRERSSTSEALRAINYYQNIGWIGAPAANSLHEYLSGLAGEEVGPNSSGGTQLTIDHHTDSLRYIGKLGGKHVDVERLEWSGSGRGDGRVERRGQRGIQR